MGRVTGIINLQDRFVEKKEIFETTLFLPFNEERKDEGGLRTKGYFKKNLQNKPLITVITVVFNGENVLEDTIVSVINQNYDNVDYIIIDGDSSDATLDVIRKYEYAIDYWISEKDNGIYDAMNKGIMTSQGQFINFINAGDCYFNHNVLSILPLDSSAKVIYGNIKYQSGKTFVSEFDKRMFVKNTLHHQATFYSIDLYKNLGLFDTDFKILADYDFNLKVLRSHVYSKKVPFYIAVCSDYGVSDIPKLINYHEEAIIRLKNNYWIGLFLYNYSYFRYFIKKLTRSFSYLYSILYKGDKCNVTD